MHNTGLKIPLKSCLYMPVTAYLEGPSLYYMLQGSQFKLEAQFLMQALVLLGVAFNFNTKILAYLL